MSEILTVLDDDSLYERYGKPLEQEHQGKYIAISRDGQVIVDADDAVVVDQAIERFGSGNFMFHRIGYSYVDKLRITRQNSLGWSDTHENRTWMPRPVGGPVLEDRHGKQTHESCGLRDEVSCSVGTEVAERGPAWRAPRTEGGIIAGDRPGLWV